jgi:hypothetical protein
MLNRWSVSAVPESSALRPAVASAALPRLIDERGGEQRLAGMLSGRAEFLLFPDLEV